MWRKLLLLFIVVSVLAGTVLLWSGEQKPVAQPNQGPQKFVAAEGRVSVKPDRRAVLSAEVAGRIDQMFVDNLAPVKKGQLLAVLYNEDLQQRIHQTEELYRKSVASYDEAVNGSRKEDVQEASANVRRAQAAVELGEKNEARDKTLMEEGVLARSAYDITEAQLKQAQSDLAAVQERLAKATAGERTETIQAERAEMNSQKYSLESLKAQYEKTLVRSPLDGIVILRYRETSEFADVGDPILEVADLSEMIVEGDVNEMDAGKVTPGQRVRITADSFPGREFSGTVYEVSAALKKRTSDPDDPAVVIDQKILPVKVRLEGSIPLKLGMKVDLKIQ